MRLAEQGKTTEGFTPAYAGKIIVKTKVKDAAWVHPRIRGEDLSPLIRVLPVMGSPPHTRGRLPMFTAIFTSVRFTPAYAGKIVVSIRLF